MTSKLNIVFAVFSITSSWGNGHATTYRSLIKALQKRGHNILFLERNTEWYAGNRDMPNPPFCETIIYSSLQELKKNYADRIRNADIVVFGPFVPEGIEVGSWIIK
jgi:spore maturation protein CgeB